MNWNAAWPQAASPKFSESSPWDALDRDQLLMLWEKKKEALALAKDDELTLRKYIVSRAFPEKKEGMNTLELGNGYELKAGVKFNYKLSDNEIVEKTLDEIAALGNDGPFIAARLVGWTPNFHLAEYRVLQEQAENKDEKAQAILKLISKMLTIADAAPTLDIKAPKVKK